MEQIDLQFQEVEQPQKIDMFCFPLEDLLLHVRLLLHHRIELSVVECPHVRDDEAALQGQQLGAMQPRQFVEYFLGFFQEVDFDPAPIDGGTATHHITLFFAARDQRDDSVMLRLQPHRKFSDRSPVAAGIAFELQQHLVLQRIDSAPSGRLLAESHEFAKLIAKVRERLEIMLTQGVCIGFCHGVSISGDKRKDARAS